MQKVEKDNLFIVSKEFKLKENEEMKLLKFYDFVKDSIFLLTLKDGKVFFCFKLNYFGSVFSGNNVHEQVTVLIVKEIDPCLLMINVIYATSKIEGDKFSCLCLNDFIYRYVEELNKKRLDEEILESSKELLNFLKNHFEMNVAGLESICEKTYSKYKYEYIYFSLIIDVFTDSNYFKLSVSKILSILNKKIRNHKYNEETSINSRELELKNSASIFTSFLPTEISEAFLMFISKLPYIKIIN